MIHDFLACDVDSACWAKPGHTCTAPLTSLTPHFPCADGTSDVPYTLVCDHRADCRDRSDESFCVFAACDPALHFTCDNGQCVSLGLLCDGQQHCLDDSHRDACDSAHVVSLINPPPPAIIVMDQHGLLKVNGSAALWPDGTLKCPDTHFQCLTPTYYCMPVFLRCNGVQDCPGGEDEAGCHEYHCKGFYRCRGSLTCVHGQQLCDGLFQCPQHDDELLCGNTCPSGCRCHGLAWTCASLLEVWQCPALRYLDASGSGLTYNAVANKSLLVHLSLARCGLTVMPDVSLPNLRSLDLSHNNIAGLNVRQLRGSPSLRTLSMSGNPVSTLHSPASQPALRLLQLDLSHTRLTSLHMANLSALSGLQTFNLSASGLRQLTSNATSGSLPSGLRVLDVRQCPLSIFPPGVMSGLQQLSVVLADNYKLCCPQTLPVGFPVAQCQAPSDEVSSCDTLLRSDVFRMFLFVFAAMALLGNAASFLYRLVWSKGGKRGFVVLITNLCLADFLMGVYLCVIGVADRVYAGHYVWHDEGWRHSNACAAAGFVALLSCQASAFIIVIITIDRFLVLRFPFSRARLGYWSAHIVSLAAWSVAFVLALLPLLPSTAHWAFYQQTGICLPLPITRRLFPGRQYSFGVLVVLNSALFLLIVLGQAVIYQSIRLNSLTASLTDNNSSPLSSSLSSSSSLRELAVARRLLSIVMTNFLCWFPVGLLGVLASEGVAVPGEASVALVIFVLPLNSALDPFLYTINVIRERRERAQLMKLKAWITSQTKAHANSTGDVLRRGVNGIN